MPSFFAFPFVAVLLGVLAGALISLANRFGVGFMTPDDDSGAGFAMALGFQMAGMLVAAGLLFGYYAIARAAIAPFGISLVASMLIVTVLASVPAMRDMRISNQGRQGPA